MQSEPTINTHPRRAVSDYVKAVADLHRGWSAAPLWASLAWQDTKQRYRRSILGPFWITASTGIMVAAMGPLYGSLLNQDVTTYFQHLAASLILWMFISTTINESCTAFVSSEAYIKQISLPLSLFVYRLMAKNAIMLAHNALVVLVVLAFLPPADWRHFWLFPVGLLLVFGNLFWLALFLAALSTRFRDIPQLVSNIVQVAFFLSPILWRADMLSPSNHFVADVNPLFHFMEVVRAPLLGEPIDGIHWLVVGGLFIVGSTVSFLFFARTRARIPYWL